MCLYRRVHLLPLSPPFPPLTPHITPRPSQVVGGRLVFWIPCPTKEEVQVHNPKRLFVLGRLPLPGWGTAPREDDASSSVQWPSWRSHAQVPQHSCMQQLACSKQTLSHKFARWLVTMVKVREQAEGSDEKAAGGPRADWEVRSTYMSKIPWPSKDDAAVQ